MKNTFIVYSINTLKVFVTFQKNVEDTARTQTSKKGFSEHSDTPPFPLSTR